MICSLISFLISFIIAFGRQAAALGKMKRALWFFPNFELKRWIFSLIATTFGLASYFNKPNSTAELLLLGFAVLFILFSFFFDMKYAFPEIKSVERISGKKIKIDDQKGIVGYTGKKSFVAYPMDVVIPRHIINDHVEDEHIVVSYCAICRSALIFNATVAGQNLYFKAAGR